MGLLSQRGYARHRKVTLRAVQKAIETGRIQTVLDEKGRPKIDAEDADRRWAERTDPAKQRAGGEKPAIPAPEERVPSELPPRTPRPARVGPAAEQPSDDLDDPAMSDDPASGDYSASEAALGEKPPNYFKSKAMRESYLARIAKLNYQQRAGELIEAKVIQVEWQKIVSTTKGRMLSVPSKLRSRIPHLTAADVATIEEEIREALTELAQGSAPETVPADE